MHEYGSNYDFDTYRKRYRLKPSANAVENSDTLDPHDVDRVFGDRLSRILKGLDTPDEQGADVHEPAVDPAPADKGIPESPSAMVEDEALSCFSLLEDLQGEIETAKKNTWSIRWVKNVILNYYFNQCCALHEKTRILRRTMLEEIRQGKKFFPHDINAQFQPLQKAIDALIEAFMNKYGPQ